MRDRFDRLKLVHTILASCDGDYEIEDTLRTVFDYSGLTTIAYLRHQDQIPTSIGITKMHHRVNSEILGTGRAVLATEVANLAGATSAKSVNQALKVNKTNAPGSLANTQQVEIAQRRNRTLKFKKCVHEAFLKTFEKAEINHFMQFQNSMNGFISIKSTKQFAKLMQELLVAANDKDVPLLGSNYNPFLLRENTSTGEFTFELRNEYARYVPTISAIEPLKDADVLKNYFLLKSHDARHHQKPHSGSASSKSNRQDISNNDSIPVIQDSGGARGIKLTASNNEVDFFIDHELALASNTSSLHNERWVLQRPYKDLPINTPVTMIRKSRAAEGEVIFCEQNDSAHLFPMKVNARAYFEIPDSPPVDEVPSPIEDT